MELELTGAVGIIKVCGLLELVNVTSLSVIQFSKLASKCCSLTVTGKTVGENLENIDIPKNQDVVSFPNNPISKEGGIAILNGTFSPNGSVVKTAGIEVNEFSGPANVFESEQDALDALFNNKIFIFFY